MGFCELYDKKKNGARERAFTTIYFKMDQNQFVDDMSGDGHEQVSCYAAIELTGRTLSDEIIER